jgi:hypothetical protein
MGTQKVVIKLSQTASTPGCEPSNILFYNNTNHSSGSNGGAAEIKVVFLCCQFLFDEVNFIHVLYHFLFCVSEWLPIVTS